MSEHHTVRTVTWQVNETLERIWQEDFVVPRLVPGFAWKTKERCPDDWSPYRYV